MNAFPIRVLAKMSDGVQVLSRTIACLLLCLVAITATTQVIGRNFFGYSPHWLEELMRYSFIWITSLGAAMLVKTNGHAAIDILVMRFTGKVRQIHQILVYAAIFVCAAILVTQGLKIMDIVHHQLSPSLRMPMSFVYAALPVGGLFMGVHSLLAVLNIWKPQAQQISRVN